MPALRSVLAQVAVMECRDLNATVIKYHSVTYSVLDYLKGKISFRCARVGNGQDSSEYRAIREKDLEGIIIDHRLSEHFAELSHTGKEICQTARMIIVRMRNEERPRTSDVHARVMSAEGAALARVKPIKDSLYLYNERGMVHIGLGLSAGAGAEIGYFH